MTSSLNLYERWRERKDREWLERWTEQHRWTELADYNSRVSKGIVHTPEFVARMEIEQAAFNAEMAARYRRNDAKVDHIE